MKRILLVLSVLLIAISVEAQKPSVWIVTDMSDKTIPGDNKEGTLNDPDDISAMAGYLLLANEFDTRGIIVTSTHRKEHVTSPDQAQWTVDYFGKAYDHDMKYISKQIKGYPAGLCLASDAKRIKKGYIPVYESALKMTSEHFVPSKSYSLEGYEGVEAMLDEINRKRRGEWVYSSESPLNILCWGSVTEPAILVSYCIENDMLDVLDRITFIAHWTNSPLHQGTAECPECVANCREDAKACAYLKEKAAASMLKYYECAAIGQHGIVSGSQKGDEYYSQFNVSELGKIFITGKYVFNGVDDSDSASYYALLGRWGVSLDDILPDGSNTAEREAANEKAFRAEAMNIRNELLRRSNMVK